MELQRKMLRIEGCSICHREKELVILLKCGTINKNAYSERRIRSSQKVERDCDIHEDEKHDILLVPSSFMSFQFNAQKIKYIV
jgi:hypothetical protein